MKKIGTMLLFSFLITGCAQSQPDSNVPKKEVIETSSSQINAPSFFHLSVLKDVNWEEAPSFVEGKIPLKGIERKIAMADSSIIANEQNEIMWFFLDPEMPTGKLSIIALKQGTTTPTPVLFQKETSRTNLDYFKYSRYNRKGTPSRNVTTFIWIMGIKHICE